jgi:FAD/FMN-containing dehydrogenase
VSVRKDLAEIVGAEYFSDDSKVLEAYASDFSLVAPGLATYLVKPKTTEQVQKVIQLANKNLLPVVPVSSQVHFTGAAIPKQGGILIDLSRMNKILEVDAKNKRVRIEAGVTWEQLTKELAKKGFRVVMPLLPAANRSVVTDHLEREVITNTVYDYGEPTQSMEVVWPTGEIFRTGSASVNGYPDSPSKGGNPTGPGIDFYRLLQGAQGTMGVVTWSNFKMQYLTKIDKILFAPVTDLNRINDFLYRLLRIRVGQECLLLNNNDLAAIIAEDFPGDFETLRQTLPPWTLILVISGLQMRPEEKIQYEMKALDDILRNEFSDVKVSDALPGFPGLGRKLLPMLRQPWPKNATYWKNRPMGACQSIQFIAKPNLADSFVRLVEEVAVDCGYPVEQIGAYVQPIEHNRACQVEFDFFYDPSCEEERAQIRNLYIEAGKALLAEGAVFTRPYGDLAPIVFDKASGYVAALKRVKDVFDPNNIMNPGNLCF